MNLAHTLGATRYEGTSRGIAVFSARGLADRTPASEAGGRWFESSRAGPTKEGDLMSMWIPVSIAGLGALGSVAAAVTAVLKYRRLSKLKP